MPGDLSRQTGNTLKIGDTVRLLMTDSMSHDTDRGEPLTTGRIHHIKDYHGTQSAWVEWFAPVNYYAGSLVPIASLEKVKGMH